MNKGWGHQLIAWELNKFRGRKLALRKTSLIGDLTPALGDSVLQGSVLTSCLITDFFQGHPQHERPALSMRDLPCLPRKAHQYRANHIEKPRALIEMRGVSHNVVHYSLSTVLES